MWWARMGSNPRSPTGETPSLDVPVGPINVGMSKPDDSLLGRGRFDAVRVRLRPSFLLTFSVLGLLAVASLVFVASRITASEIRAGQLGSASGSAELLAAASFGPQLAGNARQLTSSHLAALDQAALAARRTAGLEAVTIWSPRSRVLYATDHRLMGTTVIAPVEVRAAFSGETRTAVRDGATSPAGRFSGQQIAVAVPLYARSAIKPFAVAEVSLPYAPVAQAISDQTQRIDYILIGAALLFYAALWPWLRRASRALRSQQTPRTQALLRELDRGMEHGELLLHYQPAIDLREGRVVAVEALLRWNHPTRGLLAPSAFLPAVAGDALAGRLALHVIGMALRDCGEWRDRGNDVGVTVNLSVANVLDEELPDRIGQLLAGSGLPARALGLEVTERAIVADPEKAAAVLGALDQLGVRIAIDNFGTGYSSLACLRDLPIGELKIDRAFVAGMATRPRDEAIVRSTIRLAHELAIKVIAEGVEERATVTALAALQCDMAQGYYFSRPLGLAPLLAWFEAPAAAGSTVRAGRAAAA